MIDSAPARRFVGAVTLVAGIAGVVLLARGSVFLASVALAAAPVGLALLFGVPGTGKR